MSLHVSERRLSPSSQGRRIPGFYFREPGNLLFRNPLGAASSRRTAHRPCSRDRDEAANSRSLSPSAPFRRSNEHTLACRHQGTGQWRQERTPSGPSSSRHHPESENEDERSSHRDGKQCLACHHRNGRRVRQNCSFRPPPLN